MKKKRNPKIRFRILGKIAKSPERQGERQFCDATVYDDNTVRSKIDDNAVFQDESAILNSAKAEF
ncbi:MAG TPA: hypothetical protein DCQ99_05215 [Nitrospinae bacterium]|nr:hypothetical protein [Nitrospinota bacterium]HBA26992.1 hypothetical protein [Nitrospinota bacterium]